MIRVVVDTNVVVSVLLNRAGSEAAVIRLIGRSELQWCVSEPILVEYRDSLLRRKFEAISRAELAVVLALAENGLTVACDVRLEHSSDEPDNRFYECAQASGAKYIVTGNRRHFTEPLAGTQIVNARELLAHLKR